MYSEEKWKIVLIKNVYASVNNFTDNEKKMLRAHGKFAAVNISPGIHRGGQGTLTGVAAAILGAYAQLAG